MKPAWPMNFGRPGADDSSQNWVRASVVDDRQRYIPTHLLCPQECRLLEAGACANTTCPALSGQPVERETWKRRIVMTATPSHQNADKLHVRTFERNPRTSIMKLSARNQIKGVVKKVMKGQTTSHVQLDIGGVIVSASITNEAVDELKLKPGQTAYAVIKASDVMIGID
jgi:molybdopterin-binding protein